MRINTLKYFLIDSLKSIRRNVTVSIASIATVAATLFILGIFILITANVNKGILNVESKVEVKIYLKDNITITDQKAIENKIKTVDGIVSYDYESKAQALDNFKEQLGERNKSLTEGFDKKNPLPSSFVVKVKNPDTITNVVQAVNGMSGIDTINDGREVVDKLVQITSTIKWVGVVVFLILISVSLFLIGNTIKITVYSRRREIGIMKYIGATDWFIRWPFIMEGVIIGILGGIFADIILFYVYKIPYLKISQGLLMMQLIPPSYVCTVILAIFVGVGIIIGAVGSILSLRKFLAV
ncbi:MAG: permease-like cell division protein FtsX [Solirubrobacterales bacterium]